jgi:N-hydroxyarylamine O-acetyltransferase
MGNHLCLIVELDRPWLCDVGFGGSLAHPFPLETGERSDLPYRIGLGESGDGYWRFWDSDGGDPFSFDFKHAPADEKLLANVCLNLQTSPNSPFVQNLVVQQRNGEKHASLRGRVYSETGTEVKRKLASAEEFTALLSSRFHLDLPDAAQLWPGICARHQALGLP